MSRSSPLRCAAIMAAALTASGCHGRPRSTALNARATHSEDRADRAKGPAVVELDLSEGAPEESGSGLWDLKHGQSYFHLVSTLRDLPADPTARGVFVRMGTTQIGFARAQEVATLLEQTRHAGKKVVCHAHGYTNTTFWVAARGCDRIWVSQAGEVGLVGIAAQLLFAHKLLADKLGVDVDFLQVGKYKGAEETYTRDGPSPEARASLESVLRAIREQWLDGIGARGASARAHAEDGPFSPETARRRGFIDATGDTDDARKDAKKLAEADAVDVRYGHAAHDSSSPSFGEILHSIAGGGASFGGAPHVSIVRATGAISMESSGLTESGGVSERSLGRILRKLTEDSSARAVVLRIDSPGGSALASDLLWQKLMELRAKKPLVVSIGDMAASGGYYLASAATRIFAEPTSIVGSIGVVGGKLSFGRTLERVGVHVEIVGASPAPEARARAAYESPFQAWDAPTRERVLEQMTAVYELFVRRVSEGRKLPIDKVAEAAEGRIFAGVAAQEAGLVDEWGGLDRAIVVAKQLAMLENEAPVRLIGTGGGLWNLLDGDDGDENGDPEDGDQQSHWAARARTLAAVTSPVVSLLPTLKEALPSPLTSGEWVALRGHLASLEPLTGREHAIAALPFVLLLH